MTEFRTVLLDVDGTLVDSNDQHAESWRETLRAHGFDVSFARIRRAIGMGADKLLPQLTAITSDSERGKQIAADRSALFMRDYLAQIVPFPGTRELVLRMRDEGYTLVVASSANASELDPLLERAGVLDLLPAKTSADDAAHSKPDPDIVRAALRRADTTPDRAVMLGDTPYDVAAATKADVAIIGLTCGGWSEHELAGTLAVYNDPRDLLERYARSPLARQR